jgi:hypothetical protein
MNKRIESPLKLATKKEAKPTLMNTMESAEVSKNACKSPPELAGKNTTMPTPDSVKQVKNKSGKARKGTRKEKNS